MNFKVLCEFFQSVKDTKGLNEKSKMVEEHLNKFGGPMKPKVGDSIFPVLRLILPKLDRDRDSYQMKESKITRILVKMLDLPSGNDRNVLTTSYLSGGGCDFAEIVYSVLRKYIASYKSELTIQELNSCLDDIAKRKSESEAEEIMLKIFRKSSPADSKWIIRIILKDLKLGIASNRILNCFHKDAAALYATNNNLRKVCEVLGNPDVQLHELDIKVFDAFRPMLSKRVDAATFKRELTDKQFFVENKFDGERFQLHMKNNIFKYFSRNGFDFTEHYGTTYNTGIFTPKLQDIFKPDLNQVILDGEMMLWNNQMKKFGSKGMRLDVKKLNADGKFQPCFCVYDILLADNSILTNKPLQERLKILRKVLIQQKPGVILISQYKKVSKRQEIIDELNLSMEKEEEGIIVKDPNSIYKYSDRKGGWYKMKMEYFCDVMNDLDLILMGGSYSSSNPSLNSFIVGIRSGTNEAGLPTYLSFGKVASGLNDAELEELNKRLKVQGHPFEDFASKSKDELMWGKEVPNYWVEPKFSCILLVRATELIRTPAKSYKTPYTLRFPRVLNVRDDKPVDECLTINELLELSQQNKEVIKLNKRSIELEEILNTKTRFSKRVKLLVPELSKTDKVSEALQDLTLHVLNGSEENSKEEIENIVRRAGGTVSYKIDGNVDIILVGQYNSQIKAMSAKSNRHDIISVDWLRRALDCGEAVCYRHKEIFCLGHNYKNFLADDVDMYGDSYTEEATVESLRKTFGIIKDMKEDCSHPVTTLDKFKFSKYCAYFDKYEVINDVNSNCIYKSVLDESEFGYYHGEIREKICADVNLIIYNDEDDRKELLAGYANTNQRTDIKIVSKSFLYDA